MTIVFTPYRPVRLRLPPQCRGPLQLDRYHNPKFRDAPFKGDDWKGSQQHILCIDLWRDGNRQGVGSVLAPQCQLSEGQAFVAVNCAALPESILEGLLLAPGRGLYRAENRKAFSGGGWGTLYLDEINSMPLNLQAKLLRVLQEKQVMPLGSTQPIAVDVRIVSSSNCPPDELVRNGELRPDLLYRLNTVTLAIPP